MKKLIIAAALLAAFNACASNVGIRDLNSMNGNVNLECTSKDGDILEVDGQYSFPQRIEIQSDFYDLYSVKKLPDGKFYVYKESYSSQPKYFALAVTKKEVFIQSKDNVNYYCK